MTQAQEIIDYISAHQGATCWDIMQHTGIGYQSQLSATARTAELTLCPALGLEIIVDPHTNLWYVYDGTGQGVPEDIVQDYEKHLARHINTRAVTLLTKTANHRNAGSTLSSRKWRQVRQALDNAVFYGEELVSTLP